MAAKQNERRKLMKRLSAIAAILAVVAFSFGAFALQNGYDLFQKALAKERGEGNLEEAIALYQKVIDESKDESLAAKAQFRIGICYEKLGQAKAKLAQEAFQKVIETYPKQTDTVKLAQEKISNYIKTKPALSEEGKESKTTKIFTGGDYVDSISPDEKKLALVRGGEIWVRDIATGEEIQMTKNENRSQSTLWSPNSQRIAWVDSDGNINVIDVEKASSRILIIAPRESNKSEAIMSTSWTPDSNKVIFQVASKGLYAIPAAGGEWEDIFVFKAGWECRYLCHIFQGRQPHSHHVKSRRGQVAEMVL
jgi:Skp family chaperone for outer membrane proteins